VKAARWHTSVFTVLPTLQLSTMRVIKSDWVFFIFSKNKENNRFGQLKKWVAYWNFYFFCNFLSILSRSEKVGLEAPTVDTLFPVFSYTSENI
jgi:hypothetical protein